MKRKLVVCVTVGLSFVASGCNRGNRTFTALPPPITGAGPIEAGTEILVRTVEPIEVSAVEDGKSWAGVVSRDVRTPQGELLLAAGSPLYFGVARQDKALGLVVRSVVANGNSYTMEVPVTASKTALTGLEPWGAVTTVEEIHLVGDRISVPGQALLGIRLGDTLRLR